jgi:DNA-binding response OmpR family regulator
MNAPLRLLIADDEEDLIEVLSRRFRHLGMEVRCCGDAGACLRLLGDWSPDAALIDGRMPGNEGLWLVKQLRARRPEMPLVMLSGSADHAFKAAARDAGVARFLEKPCSLAEVEAAVLAATGQPLPSPCRVPAAGDACRAV